MSQASLGWKHTSLDVRQSLIAAASIAVLLATAEAHVANATVALGTDVLESGAGVPVPVSIVDTTAGHQVALGAGGDRVVSLTSIHSLARDTHVLCVNTA